MKLYQITAPYFCAGLIFEDTALGRFVQQAAPIIRYMRGSSIAWVMEYCSSKGWRLVEL